MTDMSRRKKPARARQKKAYARTPRASSPQNQLRAKTRWFQAPVGLLHKIEGLSDRRLVAAVFVFAVVVRLVYLGQLNDAPFFDHPVGDSKIYHERALGIAAGDIIGKEAYFHSSPFYPYFIGLVYKVFGVNFTILRLLQFLIGSLNCVLIYLLTKRICAPRKGPALLAGLAAAFYGTLVFFDGDLLMIPLVLLFVLVSVWLLTILPDSAGGPRLLRRRGATTAAALVSGVALGLAGLGKPNVLLFAPFAVAWILTGFSRSFYRKRWRAGALFVFGCVLAVFPITLRNYAVSHDFVLVSSNAGVNFYIGNNDLAEGIYFLPPDSGLDNARLYLSSRAAAEEATGKSNLKPSAVSAYWTGRALDFFERRPGDAAALLLRKFRLFWNHYEIPNHHNKYFIARTYAPFLGALPVGYGLIAPLAAIGLFLLLLNRPVAPPVRLYIGFAAVYMLSLIPFFITARYRLPVVPFLVVFASMGVWRLAAALRGRRWRFVFSALAVGAAVAVFVWWPMVDYDFGFNHTVIGTVYSDLATEQPENAVDHVQKAIVEFKTALELRPLSVDANYNLGVTYQRIGYFSGAVAALEAAVALQPTHVYAGKALAEARASLADSGDKIEASALPLTPFEAAVALTRSGNTFQAAEMYERVLRRDPHHPGAHSQLGAISFDRGDFEAAIGRFKKGLRYNPNHFVLNNNIAGAYYKVGDNAGARRHWERCLETDPGNESVLRQLRMLGG